MLQHAGLLVLWLCRTASFESTVAAGADTGSAELLPVYLQGSAGIYIGSHYQHQSGRRKLLGVWHCPTKSFKMNSRILLHIGRQVLMLGGYASVCLNAFGLLIACMALICFSVASIGAELMMPQDVGFPFFFLLTCLTSYCPLLHLQALVVRLTNLSIFFDETSNTSKEAKGINPLSAMLAGNIHVHHMRHAVPAHPHCA